MTHRERILASIEHKPVDRIPTDYWGTTEATLKFMKELGASNVMELWEILDIDKILGAGPGYIGPALDDSCDYWGVKYRAVSYADNQGTYYEMCGHPLQQYETIEEIEANYAWPSADWFDFSTVAEQCERHPEHAIEAGYVAPFYMFNNIRGLEQSLMDLSVNEEFAFYIIDKICSFLYDYHERLFESAKGKIDITQVTDDFGTQTGLMISIKMFEKYFEKHYRRFIKLAKDHGIKVFHHDDGSIMPIMPKLAKLGIDILNPIQWHLPGMDLNRLKQGFGDKICFHGGVDNQHVLPFGTVSEVEREVAACMDSLWSDRTGYILAPCHNVQSITPVENLLAMYRTAYDY